MNYNELLALRHPASEKAPCVEALEWFLATYGDADVPVTAATLRAVPTKDWVYWLSDALGLQLGYKFAGIAFRYAAKHYPELAPFADNVTPKNAEAATGATVDAAGAAKAAWAAAANAAWAAAEAAWAAAEAAENATAEAAATEAATECFELAVVAVVARLEEIRNH